MENTDNQEDIIEDIVESDLLSLEQGEVEESVSEDVEEIAEAGKKPTSEDSELKKAKAEEGEEEEEEGEDEEEEVSDSDDSPAEEEEDEDEEAVTEDVSAQPDPVVANKPAEGDAAERFLKGRRKKKKGETSQDPETGEGEGLDAKEIEKIAKASDAEEAEGSGVQEDVIASEDLTRLVEEEEGLTPEFKAKAALIFEAEVRTKVEEVTEQLQSEHEAKLSEEVEAINETLTNQVDAYLTYAVEEWIGENKVAVESSLRTSIAENFMKSLKTLFEENYVEVPESKVDLYDELEEEASQLKEELTKFKDIADTLADRVDDLNREKILSEASAGLAETQAAKLHKLAEGVEFNEDFTKNVETLKKFYFTGEGETLTEESLETEDETVETIVEGADVEEETSEAPVDPAMAKYMETLGRLEKSSS
jgi:hypothetical protein